MWRKATLVSAFVCVYGSLAGCGSPDLTCELLADPGNCWAAAAATLAACVPAGETGVLAADRATCSFSDGAVVVFDAPLPQFTEDLERFGFTIEVDGATCARFVDTFANRMELTGDDGTVVSELHAGEDFHLHCPDQTFEAPFDRLFECAAIGAPPPTDGFSVEPDLVTFALSAITTPGELFRCAPSSG